MKKEIKIQIKTAYINTDWDKLNELMDLCGGNSEGMPSAICWRNTSIVSTMVERE